ncbi:MAG TPA: hypothetical protein VMY40_13275 [Anaerolineae bacterium]|nr:hypothetical protein [Anaerolineae bacterium]
MARQRAHQRPARRDQAGRERAQPGSAAPPPGPLQQRLKLALLEGRQAPQKLTGQLRFVPGQDVGREANRTLDQAQGTLTP